MPQPPRIGGLLVAVASVVVLLLLLPWGAEAGAYNPPLGEDARLDQIDDYPGKCWIEWVCRKGRAAAGIKNGCDDGGSSCKD